MADRMDPTTRARVSAAGGRARLAGLEATERSAFAAAGARAMHSPLGLARRIARAWPELDEEAREAVREVLLPLLTEGGGEILLEGGDVRR